MRKALLVLAIVCSVLAVWVSVAVAARSIRFTNGCTGYLKLAANAATVERAEVFLTKVVDYIDKNDLNIGNSSIFIERPTNDLQEWSKNLRTARNLLARLIDDPNTSQLTKDNTLMKIREVILKESNDDNSVNVPDNIALYPWQAWFVMVTPFLWLLTVVFWVLYALYPKKEDQD